MPIMRCGIKQIPPLTNSLLNCSFYIKQCLMGGTGKRNIFYRSKLFRKKADTIQNTSGDNSSK